jgi:hypothetical protein
MGLGKTYSTKYLLDSNNSSGVEGQVLISTPSGIDWVDGSGSGIIGGPYLPLAGGTMTGTAGVLMPDNFILKIGTGNDLTIKHNATDSFIENYTGHLSIVNYSNDKDTILWGDDGTGGISKYLVLEGISTNAYFSNPGNVGIGTTSPNYGKLQVYGNSSSDWAGYFYNQNTSGIGLHVETNAHGTEQLLRLSSLNGSGGSNTVKMVVRADGNVGIGTTDPGARLVVTSSNLDDTNTLKINHTRNDANVATRAVEVDMNLSGADTTTTDRNNYGIFVDLDSSADGDAVNEHRIHGVGSDVRFTGFSDLVRGAYFYVESNNNTEKTTVITGVEGKAIHDSNSTNGGVTSMYGVRGNAIPQNLGDVDNAYGGYFAVDLTNNRGSADFGVSKGVEGHINIDKASTVNYGAMTAVSGIIDNNEGTVPNFGNQYLFKGDYQGTKGSNAWGIYVEGDKHYFDGNVGIGTTSPLAPLHIVTPAVGGIDLTDISRTANNLVRFTNPQYSTAATMGILLRVFPDSDARQGAGLLMTGGSDNAASNLSLFVSKDDGSGNNISKSYSALHIAGNTGRVGIGTTSPAVQLELGDNGADEKLRLTGPVNSKPTISFYNTTTKVGQISANPVGLNISSLGSGDMSFSNGTGLLVIENGGNVGIGTTSPATKLHVSGANTVMRLSSTSSYVDMIMTNSSNTGFLNLDGSKMNFFVGGGSSGDLKMSIGTNGNVGIGTTSPAVQLELGDNTADEKLRLTGAASGKPLMTFYNTTTKIGQISSSSVGVTVSSLGSGNMTFENGGGARFVIDNSGNVGIADTSPSYKLDVDGTIRATGDVIAYSDVRVKENIKTIDNAITKVNKLRGVEFNKIGSEKKSIGVIAQEIEKVLPEVVKEDDKGMKSVAYGNIVGVLIEAIKDQQKQIDELKSIINGGTK